MNKLIYQSIGVASIALTPLFTSQVFAVELVTNGGFESGVTSSWTWSSTGSYGPSPRAYGSARTGSIAYQAYSNDATGYGSQDLTILGNSYTLKLGILTVPGSGIVVYDDISAILSGSTVTLSGYALRTDARSTASVKLGDFSTEVLSLSGAGYNSFSFSYSFAPSAASTLTSIQSASYGIASQFAGFAMSTNYANLNTYDCGLFDQDGGCFSVGGRYSDVNGNNNTDSSSSALVVVGGYKLNNHFRVAGFIDQQANSSTPNGITLDNKGPMVGMSLVWNQHPDHLGYQVKVANAYQSKDLSITRTATGDAEAGRGDTEIEVQSYVAEVSYQFSDGVKTFYRPYFALRRAIIKQDGYTETDVDNPLTFNTLEDKSTTVIMGMKAKYKLSNQVTLNGALGVEHDVDNDIDKLQATSSTITGLTAVDINSSINKTRPVATMGATYHISPNQTLSAQTQYQELAYTSTSAKTAYVNYTVGF